MSEGQRVVLHVDLDAFYVSAEVRERPSLKGLPVVVGADPENGKGRGVVVTCSYEARKFGLRSGMPISQAYRLCPTAIFIRPNWSLYERVSEEVMSTLEGLADKFEQASIDEAFLEVSSKATDEDSSRRYAMKVKKTVKELHGLTASIGVAPNKSSSKIASDMQKPDGLTIVPFKDIKGFLAPLPVSVVPGIGKKTQEFLKEKGIASIGELQKKDGKTLLSWFGKNGVWLWAVVHGEENVEVRNQEMPKSLSVERTFKEDVRDFPQVREAVADASAELARRVKSSNLTFQVGGIKIRFRGFETHTRERTLPAQTDTEAAIREVADSLLDEFEKHNRPVRLVGVRVAGLKRKTAEPTSLDAWAQDAQQR